MAEIYRDDAIVNLISITVCPENRMELYQTISSLIDSVKSEKGCLTYRIYEEAEAENTFILIGEWETPEAWNSHLHSDNLAVLLGSISLLCDRSYIEFKLLSHVTDVEAVTRARIGCHGYAVNV